MEYLTLGTGHLLTIIIPLQLIINRIIGYVMVFHSKKVEKIFKTIDVIFAIISTLIFYKLHYGEYFCGIWLLSLLMSPWFYGFISKISSKDSYKEISEIDFIFFILNVIGGTILIIIPYTRVFHYIGGGYNFKVDIVSKYLFLIFGLCIIFLNKYISNKIYNYFHKNSL
ncbi:hypothetical protein ACOAKC_08475 [Hathewaya histolytica]|uniref:hypothetical protein n=1 Tax=Hathewaya histolytica TaxID=1498 RepID=UPI003B66C56E